MTETAAGSSSRERVPVTQFVRVVLLDTPGGMWVEVGHGGGLWGAKRDFRELVC